MFRILTTALLLSSLTTPVWAQQPPQPTPQQLTAAAYKQAQQCLERLVLADAQCQAQTEQLQKELDALKTELAALKKAPEPEKQP